MMDFGASFLAGLSAWRKVKTAEFRDFLNVRLTRNCMFAGNDLACKRDALAALELAAKLAVGGFGRACSTPRHFAHLAFLQGIANANEHHIQSAIATHSLT
jgi:hypothetical protein